MRQHIQYSHSETGAVLVHVALVLIGLMALSTFIVDQGVLWAARRQAQNAADAGALAGAVHMLYDADMDPDDPDVLPTARAVALENKVWATAPFVTSTFECPLYVAFDPTNIDCIRVDVYRDQAHGNPLPMLFGAFLGRNRQNIRATATARVNTGNAADCLKPFAVLDLPSPGYTLDAHLGTEVTIKTGPGGQQTAPGWFRLLDFTGGGGGTPEWEAATKTCMSGIKAAGQDLQESGNIGSNAPRAVQDMYDLDDQAHYVPGQGIVGSCAETQSCQKYVQDGQNQYHLEADPSRTISPRVFILPVVDPVKAANGELEIVNFFGFFIHERPEGPPFNGDFEMTGILVSQPGLYSPGAGTVPNASAFLKIIQLIR